MGLRALALRVGGEGTRFSLPSPTIAASLSAPRTGVDTRARCSPGSAAAAGAALPVILGAWCGLRSTAAAWGMWALSHKLAEVAEDASTSKLSSRLKLFCLAGRPYTVVRSFLLCQGGMARRK